MKGTEHSALCLCLSPPLSQCNGQARHMGASWQCPGWRGDMSQCHTIWRVTTIARDGQTKSSLDSSKLGKPHGILCKIFWYVRTFNSASNYVGKNSSWRGEQVIIWCIIVNLTSNIKRWNYVSFQWLTGLLAGARILTLTTSQPFNNSQDSFS